MGCVKGYVISFDFGTCNNIFKAVQDRETVRDYNRKSYVAYARGTVTVGLK